MNEEQRINIMEEAATQPAGVSAPALPYASITERFVALAIDYGIIFLPFRFLVWLLSKVAGEYVSFSLLVALAVLANVVFVLYEAVFSSGGRVTLGKNLVGIAVVNKDRTAPISFGRALCRAIGYYVSLFLLFGGFVLALVDDRKRALHDFLGGSVVVQLRERAPWEVWSVRAMGLVLLLAFIGSIYQSFGGREWQDKQKVNRAKAFLQNIALLEEGHRLRYGYYTNDLLRLALLSGDPVQFQRDVHRVLATGQRSMILGVEGEVYKISAVAKDSHHTRVYFTNKM